MSVVLQPGGVERGLFPFVLIVFRNFAPIQSAGPAPAIDDDSLLERLVACSDHHAIALSGGPLISNTPVKHQRLELELLQGLADITRPMAAVATLSQADVNQEALKLRVENNMIFAFETTRCRMRGHRRQLGLARIHVRCESYERVAQVLNRSLVSSCRSIDQKQECKDEENAADHSKQFPLFVRNLLWRPVSYQPSVHSSALSGRFVVEG